jgi:dihydrofolate reductase
MSVIATINVGANGATSLHGSSRALSTPVDRAAFLALHRSAGSYLLGYRSFIAEQYSPCQTPIIILTRKDREVADRDDVTLFKVESDLKSSIAIIKEKFPKPILVEAGVTLLTELIGAGCIEELYLNSTPIDGDDHFVDIEELLQDFEIISEESKDGTTLRKCRYKADSAHR